MANLDGWTTNVASLVMKTLHGHDLASARTLADAWLTANGGWDPDDVGDPTGNGAPVGNPSDSTVAAAIAAAEIAKTKTLTVTFPIVVKASAVGSFGNGTSTSDILDALKADIEARMNAVVFEQGAQVMSFTWGSASPTASSGGSLSSGDRTTLQAEISGPSPHLVSPGAIATAAARRTFYLDNTWMASTIYTRNNTLGTQVSVEIRKYTTTGYTSLDAVSYFYVVGLDRRSGQPQTLTRVDS